MEKTLMQLVYANWEMKNYDEINHYSWLLKIYRLKKWIWLLLNNNIPNLNTTKKAISI